MFPMYNMREDLWNACSANGAAESSKTISQLVRMVSGLPALPPQPQARIFSFGNSVVFTGLGSECSDKVSGYFVCKV